jgi:uncharacterized protein YbbC (DUF1343 family)
MSTMKIASGLDVLKSWEFEPIRRRSIGIVCNQAAVCGEYSHLLDLVLPLHRSGELMIASVMGPQHGLFGHTQDNMIEWEGKLEPRTGLAVHSLYGANREPTAAMLAGVEILVIDLFDVGSRYYTFIWTLALCLKACEARGIRVLLLDRPNPIGGLQVEGTVLDPSFASFVGLHPLPTRHGMTLGEIARYFKNVFYPLVDLEVVQVRNWQRGDDLTDAGGAWAMPSPNMPTVDTAYVYPGGCLLEGTNLSEGRGTTRPFETFGAPWIDGWRLAEALNGLGLPGGAFRPIQFEPTFQKHAGKLCEGCFVHVTSRRAFQPVLVYVAILQEVRRLFGDLFQWNEPPYEYETVKLPIDILAGNDWLRPAVDCLSPLGEIRHRFLEECSRFEPTRRESLLYPST